MAKITVGFGLLSVACNTEGAIDKPVEPVNLCHGQPDKPEHEHAPLKRPATCDTCGPITDFTVLDKGYPEGGGYRVVDRDSLDEAREEIVAQYRRTLNLVPHPVAEFMAATGPGDTINYLVPRDVSAASHYALLAEFIGRHPELAFVSQHTPRSVTSVYVVTVRQGVLVMTKRTRETSMKPVPVVGGADFNPVLLDQLEAFLPGYTEAYDAALYEDQFRAALDRLVADGASITMDADSDKAATPVAVDDDALIAQFAALTKKARGRKKAS